MDRETLTFPEIVWAGNKHSLDVARDAYAAMSAATLVTASPKEEDETPYNFSLQGSIGVISLKGPLVNKDSPFNRFYGVISYGEIRTALMYAASKPEVKAILLDIASGGGAVNGVADTGNLIAMIDKKVKPVFAFTDSTMASAAYWLGSSARKVYNSKLSVVGSIGVLATHLEYSKALKDMGIGATVVRAGKYKALVNSIEPLSEAAEKQLQAQLDAAYEVFVEHVADARGVSFEVADGKMAQGREFFGEGAVDVGLSDGIRTFDGLVSELHAKLDTNNQMSNNRNSLHRGELPMTRKALTEQEIQALAAAGIDPNASIEAPPEADPAPAPAADPVAEVPESKEEKPAAPAQADVLAYVQSQLVASQAEVVELKVKLQGAEAKVQSMKATHSGLVEVVAASLTNMRVALRLPAVDCSKLAPEALLAEHSITAEALKKSFKAGGVAAVSPPETPAKVEPDPHHKARVAATRLV